MLSSKLELYKYLFYKSFFFDKYLVKSVYQCPKIQFLKLKFLLSSQVDLTKFKFCKLIFLFYLITSQRPKLLVQSCNLRNTQHKKITGFRLTLHRCTFFINFLMQRLVIFSSIYQPILLTYKRALTFEISQKVQDDDILSQCLNISNLLKYQVTLISNSKLKSHLRSLLFVFKIPCKLI